jgi:hypothetical protein
VAAHNEVAGYPGAVRTTARFVGWTVAWAATLAIARLGPRLVWDSDIASWVAVAANVAVGIGWIVAFTRLLRAMDELQRKILMDALAVTLGFAWVAGFAYVVADLAGLVQVDVGIAAVPVVLGVVFMIAFGAGRLRYR